MSLPVALIVIGIILAVIVNYAVGVVLILIGGGILIVNAVR